jgi:DNA-binding CsgD family transcriptional regulator/catechol 2,3-dioxygenase-like lactoylglutathione lyase family enzyme
MGRRLGRPPHDDLLTPAEWRIVQWVKHGLTNRAIAARHGVSLDAVKFHVANALQKLGLPDRQHLRHWDGVPRNSMLHGRTLDMSQQLTLGPVGQISRTVKDIVAAREWYGSVLGLPHLYSFGDLAFFDCGGLRLFLSQSDEASSQTILYFRVGDIRAAHAQLSARGVSFINAPHLIHRHDDGMEEWMAFFNDPDGGTLALMCQLRP